VCRSPKKCTFCLFQEPAAIITAVRKGTMEDIKKVIRLGGDVNMKKEVRMFTLLWPSHTLLVVSAN
jgi:hypothetical protein